MYFLMIFCQSTRSPLMWKHELVTLVTSPFLALKNDFEAQLVSLSGHAQIIVDSQIDSSSFFSLLNSHKVAMRVEPLQLRRLC